MSTLNKKTLAALFTGSDSVRSSTLSAGEVSQKAKVPVFNNLPHPKQLGIKKRKGGGKSQSEGTTIHKDQQLAAPVNKKQKSTVLTETEIPAKKAKSSHSGDVIAVTIEKKKKHNKKNEPSAEFKERLLSGRFRYINELLYTTSSQEALKSFTRDPGSFDCYHQGYRKQIEKWPVKPIDLAIKFVKARPKNDVIADLGCGEALLAASVPQKCYSYDLVAANDRVTVADMSRLPLQDCTVNVVILCLSLMGTNLADFLKEARRILVADGVMWIAEVSSRFANDLRTFTENVETMGFKCINYNTEISHFVTITFRKTESVSHKSKNSKKQESITLAPCLYKKR